MNIGMQNSEITEDEIAILNNLKSNINKYSKVRGSLVPILQMMQKDLSYLPEQAVKTAADYLEISESEVYGVATFYNQFRFNPPGKYPIKVCMGTACHVKGSDIILENFERKLGIKSGQTTEDREFSIEEAACVGCCALAPVAIVGETTYGHMSPSKVEGIFVRLDIENK